MAAGPVAPEQSRPPHSPCLLPTAPGLGSLQSSWESCGQPGPVCPSQDLPHCLSAPMPPLRWEVTAWALSPLVGLGLFVSPLSLTVLTCSEEQFQPRGRSCPGMWVMPGVLLAGSCAGEGDLAPGWLVSGSWVKSSAASPCPWLCQPQRKGADISAFVHFMSIYGHLGSLLTPSSQAWC